MKKFKIFIFLMSISYYQISNNADNLEKSELEKIFTQTELQEIRKIQVNKLTPNDKEAIINLIRICPWLTLEEATGQHQLTKKNTENLKKFEESLTSSFKIFFAFLVIKSIYDVIQSFILPSIQNHLYSYSIQPQQNLKNFDSIAGYSHIKKQLKPIINNIKKQIKDNNLKKIDGLLFYGEPGCGKTLFAEAIGAESHAHFFSIKASDLINKEGVVGEQITLMFEKVKNYAKNNGPCILFIDEIDFLVGNRNKEKLDQNEKTTLQHLLTFLDGEKPLKGVLVIGNTNHKNQIDQALLRNGRLGNHIKFELPTQEDIKEIILTQCKKLNIDIDEKFLSNHFVKLLFGKNVASIISSLDNINNFITENNYSAIINEELITAFQMQYIL